MAAPDGSLSTNPPPSPWRLGLAAARANLVAGLCLQAFVLLLLAAYFWHAPTRAALESLAAFRLGAGLPFDMVLTALSGAVFPAAILALGPVSRGRQRPAQIAALTAFWAYKGLEVSFFYGLQARVFGEGHDAATIVAKTLVDQLLYCPLMAIPLTWLAYTWTENRFATETIWAEIRRPGFYRRRILPLLLPTWAVWIPAVAVIYVLPTALQLPLQNIVLCFYTLLVAFVTRSAAK